MDFRGNLSFTRVLRRSRLFDPTFYLWKYPDVAAAKLNPLSHYVRHGSGEGRKPNALFEPEYYARRCPEARNDRHAAVMHFLHRRGRACPSPHPLFDCEAYVRAHPDAELINPVQHHLLCESLSVRSYRTEPARVRFVILHYHFLKNAGTSIENILHRSFGGYFQTIDTAHRDGHVSTEALLDLIRSNPLLKAVSSHQIRYPVPAVPGFIFFDVCILRDPIDRVRSMYDYFREKPAAGDPVSELANRLELGRFVEHLVNELPWYVNDAQVNLLANGIANDPPTLADFDRATAQMMRTSFLGVVDRFNESLIAGQHSLSTVFPELDCDSEAVNVSRGLESTLDGRIAKVKDACSADVYEKLLRLNQFDARLVNLARQTVLRRYARVARP